MSIGMFSRRGGGGDDTVFDKELNYMRMHDHKKKGAMQFDE